MQTTKKYERINWYKKEFIYEQYSRIVEKIKNYDQISRKKMLEAIYNVYSDYKNIIDICTERELKYLQMVLNNKKSNTELFNDKYEWERKNLHNKFLLDYDYPDRVFIPDEITQNVKEALKHINWDLVKGLDNLNKILVSYCKIQGSALVETVAQITSYLTNISIDNIKIHIAYNKLFNYYVMVYPKYIKEFDKELWITLYQDYYDIEDVLDEERKKQGIAGTIPIDLNIFETLFYNDFDINNKKIKKMLNELKELPFFWTSALKIIKEFALLNIDRADLKESIKNVPALKNIDLTAFFKILDEAMDEMPSGALNGFTPNQAKEIALKTEKEKFLKEQEYIKQTDACLSKSDAKLFYKIYFALLEFTNNKYIIKKNFKIYKQLQIDPNDLIDIVEKFWENKENLVNEFCDINPYKFNQEELNITKEFKKGFREIIIIAKFEEEYTAIMNKDKVYMIKGINDNIDNVISYQDLPMPTITSIIPFKGNLIYDGMISSLGINMRNEFTNLIKNEYKKAIKYYHL